MSLLDVVKSVWGMLVDRGVQPNKHLSYQTQDDGSVLFTLKDSSTRLHLLADRHKPIPGPQRARVVPSVKYGPRKYHYDESGHIDSMIMQSPTMRVFTQLDVGVSRDSANEHGRGDTVGDHENSHIADMLQYMIQVPSPRFRGHVGQDKGDFKHALDDYKHDWGDFGNTMNRCSQHITDSGDVGGDPGDSGLQSLQNTCQNLIWGPSGPPGPPSPSGPPGPSGPGPSGPGPSGPGPFGPSGG